ncbi:MAG: RagB/SusD family nutrient uptake outer membrane protein [Prevotella sp.]|nr:RagB/SusD family nutrient uptake outer membrane protein [Prevotella sp.]MBQ9646708.1 RagB/SusD family nutrient uptake outer membrane protein [Prevotella sp.]
MRKIYNKIMCAVALLGGLTSCSDFLEIKSQSEIVLEDFWNEKADVDNIVAGCYSALQDDGVMRRMMVWGEFRSENVMAGQNINDDINLENVLKESITAMNAYTTWDGFYNVINRCNTVIKYAPQVAQRDPGYTQSELQATIAEVSALRDLCFFYLIRTFRDVPYSTEAFTDDDQKMDLPATPFNAVLDSLIQDLEAVQGYAVQRYPETSPLYQTGRITQDAIHAMLCEMYLWKQDYDQCIRYADMVIDSKKKMYEEKRSQNASFGLGGSSQNVLNTRMNGYPLVNSLSSGYYGNTYTEVFVNGNSQETVFELLFDKTEAGYTMPGNSAVGAFYGNASVDKGLVGPSTTVTEDIAKTSSRTIFADRNKKVDARLYENVNMNTESINKFASRGLLINATQPTNVSVSYMAKYPFAKINNVNHYYNSSSWVIYRLSDIMLLKAEALCQKMLEGSDEEINAHNQPLLAQAFSLVNAVNKRSVCEATLVDTLVAGDYLTKAQMEQLVLQERQRELMFEGKRWYDLVRRSLRDGNTQVLSSAAQKRDGVNGQFIQNFFQKMDAIFWPYNNDEIKVNRNLVQNPSFGSGENSSYEKTK